MYLEGDKLCGKKKIEQDKVDQVCQGRGLQFSSQKMSWIWHRLSSLEEGKVSHEDVCR